MLPEGIWDQLHSQILEIPGGNAELSSRESRTSHWNFQIPKPGIISLPPLVLQEFCNSSVSHSQGMTEQLRDAAGKQQNSSSRNSRSKPKPSQATLRFWVSTFPKVPSIPAGIPILGSAREDKKQERTTGFHRLGKERPLPSSRSHKILQEWEFLAIGAISRDFRAHSLHILCPPWRRDLPSPGKPGIPAAPEKKKDQSGSIPVIPKGWGRSREIPRGGNGGFSWNSFFPGKDKGSPNLVLRCFQRLWRFRSWRNSVKNHRGRAVLTEFQGFFARWEFRSWRMRMESRD